MKHLVVGKTEYGVPQGSILGSLLFSIHLCDHFCFLEDVDIPNYVDDTTIYTVKENKESVINTLEASSLPLFIWFNNNFMKANSGKSHILLSRSEPSAALIDGSSIESNTKEILLGIAIDRDLKFDEHVNNPVKKHIKNLMLLHLSQMLIKKNDNESFHRIAIWILPISLDVP